MRLPAHPNDFATFAVSLSQLLSYNCIVGSYDGITVFADRMPSIEQMNERLAAAMVDQ